MEVELKKWHLPHVPFSQKYLALREVWRYNFPVTFKSDRETLTTEDAGKLCSVDSRTILNWIKSGKLKSYQTAGGHHRILKQDLWAFIKEVGLPFLDPKPRPDTTKRKILLVDDDRDILESLREGLSHEGDWLIETADSSLEAGLKFGSWRPDLLILDMMMPGFDGHDFCVFLKKTIPGDHLPVIVLTAAEHNEKIVNEMKGLGVFSYLKKSGELTELIHTIRRYFQLSAP